MNEIVTGDETWVYFYESDGKEKNKMWVGKNDNGPKMPVKLAPQNAYMYAFSSFCEFWENISSRWIVKQGDRLFSSL
jgi:hypothetical protein